MIQILGKEELVDILASRALFSKSDTRVFLDTLQQVLEESVSSVSEEDLEKNPEGIELVTVRGIGSLKVKRVNYSGEKRPGKMKSDKAFSVKVMFKLSSNIRFNRKEEE